ncbi:MAG: hypothetical protein ACTHKY_03425 [Ginsengibacter sp.]
MASPTVIKQRHQGRQIKHVMDLCNISIDELSMGINMEKPKVLELLSKETIADEFLNRIANFLKVPSDLIKNFNEDLKFSTNIHSSNNTIINYNHMINQNSAESIAQIYEVVRNLIKKEESDK